MRLLIASLTVLSFSILSPQADAQTRNVTVKSGKKTTILGNYFYNPETCSSMMAPKAKVRSAGNGKVNIRRQRARVPKGKPCSGISVQSTVISYQSKAGFRGKDKVVVGFSGPRFVDGTGHSYRKVTFNITVR